MFGLITRRGPHSSRTSSRRTNRSMAPQADALEGRRLLTLPGGPTLPGGGTINPDAIYAPFRLSQGTLTITGTGADEYAFVTMENKGTSTTADDEVVARLRTSSSNQEARFPRAGVLKLSIAVGGGDDTVRNFTSIPASINGGSGSDLIVSGEGNDTVRGGAGDDTLVGGGGHDQLFGEAGEDLLQGDAGDDRLDGGKDGRADRLIGGAGADTFIEHYSDEYWYVAVYDGYEHEDKDINNDPNDGDVRWILA